MKIKLDLPDKIFGMESQLLLVYLPLLGVALMFLISVNLVFIPNFDNFKSTTASIKQVEKQKTEVLDKTKYLQSIDQEELKKNSDSINSALLPEKNAYLLVGVVKRIADNFGFQIDSFVVNPGILSGEDNKKVDKTPSTVSKIPIKMILVGPTSKYLELIKGIELSLPILSIDDFKMQSDTQAVKLNLTISAYYIGTNIKVDPEKISLADLALTKEESELLVTLNSFTKWDNQQNNAVLTPKNFVNYDRTDPFLTP